MNKRERLTNFDKTNGLIRVLNTLKDTPEDMPKNKPYWTQGQFVAYRDKIQSTNETDVIYVEYMFDDLDVEPIKILGIRRNINYDKLELLHQMDDELYEQLLRIIILGKVINFPIIKDKTQLVIPSIRLLVTGDWKPYEIEKKV